MRDLLFPAARTHATDARSARRKHGGGVRCGCALPRRALPVAERVPAEAPERRLSRATILLVTLLVCTGAARQADAADSLQTLIDRSFRAAAAKDFARAEEASSEALRRFPNAPAAQRTHAFVLLWQGKYAAARELFARVVASNPRDVEARTGLAQAYYWSGDDRGALRELERVLELQPRHEEAARAIAGICAATRPGYAIDAGILDDDQPYRSAGAAVRVFFFSDPLTKWELLGGGSDIRAASNTHDTARVGLTVETSIPMLRTRVRAGAEWSRHPDGESALLPSVSVIRSLGSTELTLRAERRPLLRSAPALDSHVSADAVSLRWGRQEGQRLLFAAGAEHLRHSDDNSGWGADAYLLAPLLRSGTVTIFAGASTAYRDTREPRFRIVDAATGEGVYDPYHTPHELREVRAIASVTANPAARLTVSAHLDGGIARDRVIAAGGLGELERTFHPWRFSVAGGLRLTPDVVLSLSASRETTAFYTADELRIAMAGRF